MAANFNNTTILPVDGTDQQQRFIDALNPDNLNLQDFSVADWMKFAWHFAEKINYFNSGNQKEGNWQDFFVEESKIKELLDGMETNGSLTPNLTLFICFLKLLDSSKKHFNQLTKRHLDFYYQQILKIEKQPSRSDKVHVIFELAKNSLPEKIDKNTALDAGKDANGSKLIFNTQDEFILTKASIGQLKNVYHHSNGTLNRIKACAVANSLDGKGKALSADDTKWYPFGYVIDNYTASNPELPDARLGFALASPVLNLKEGTRTIYVNMIFQNVLQAIPDIKVFSYLSVYLSGEKKWLGPFDVKTLADRDIEPKTKRKGHSEQEKQIGLNFKIELDKSVAPIVAYNSGILGERFTTTEPVMRFIIDTQSDEGYSFCSHFSKLKLKSISLSVDVEGMKGLELENDLGILNPKKPFLPFGPIPVNGSKFVLKNAEVFDKNWDQLDIKIVWMNKPAALKDQYFAYRKAFFGDLTPDSYKSEITVDGKTPTQIIQNATNLIVGNDDYFKASVELFSKNEWTVTDDDFLLFNKNETDGSSQLQIENEEDDSLTLGTKKFDTSSGGQLRLRLNQSFLHEMYPRIYAMAMLNDKSTLIPKEPYTPMIESIELNYLASDEATFNETTGQKTTGQSIQLFHEHPFGQCRKPVSSADQSVVRLLPEYEIGGELYIGLKDAEPLQQISLLFQVFEGSENPQAEGFSENEKIEWSILCSDIWMPLTSNYLISNNTDNFLKSGIVKFSIPAEATKDNTLLDQNLIWVRAKMVHNFDVVCKIIDIRPQAVLAQFSDNHNELSHLATGLPGNTISKLIDRKQAVKAVNQPFNSFDGLPVESDLAYYQRISERLRHKNRAITLWDYEHLILQQFPEIHKVRCLNHTSKCSFLSPGNVTIVVVPDILNKNVFDIYEPRVSRATINKIRSYINQLNTLHVNAVVINPEYESVEISLEVRFYSGFDENYYTKVLQEDLTKLLSPWAFEKTAEPQFGTTLHKSEIINFIEKLQYVDYITELKMTHQGEVKSSVSPSNPKAVLVSAKQHPVTIAKAGCLK